MDSYSQPHWATPTWAYSGLPDSFSPYSQLSDYPQYLPDSMASYHNDPFNPHLMARATESKPRLSKEEVETLEAEFQKNHKPNSSTKKALAESMRVDHSRINNWFQNRRAREKKENNIREYEARQRLEKEKSETETERQESDRKRDLVASSAPFPEPRQPSLAKEQCPDSPSESSASESTSDTTDVPSPSLAARRASKQSIALSYSEEAHFCLPEDEETAGKLLAENIRDYIFMQDAHIDFSRHPITLLDAGIPPIPEKEHENYFGDFQGFDFQPTQYQATDHVEQDVSPTSSSKQLKSPAPMDIASRRNRRPAPLTIKGSLSYSGFPRTSLGIPRRSEQGSAIRRVASVSGPVRVTKPTATPRSPFLQRHRSPPGSVAPPTPNTPVVNCSNAALPMFAKYSSSALIEDPTLRTPPTTPGIMDNMFNASSGCGMTISDELLINSNVGSFPSDFGLPSAAVGASGYTASVEGCLSQPMTPLFGPHVYSNLFAGNANYTDAPASGRSSSELSLQHHQFLNIEHSGSGHAGN